MLELYAICRQMNVLKDLKVMNTAAWVLDGEFIKNKKSRTCLTSLHDGSVKPFACSKTQDIDKRSITKIIIEGTEVKNGVYILVVRGWCLLAAT
jgi:hypothetical protein